MSIINKYQQDLIKSTKTPLLIELNKKDLKEFGEDSLKKAVFYSQELYNTASQNKEVTNLIYIDGDNYNIDNNKDDHQIILLEKIIELTSKQIQSGKNIEIVKATISGALSYFTGGLFKDTIGGYVDVGIDQVSDLLKNKAADILTDSIEAVSEDTTNDILNRLDDKINNNLTINEEIKVNLNLSSEAKTRLNELSKQFDNNLTPVGIFSLILQLILSIVIQDKKNKNTNKIIFINNPHRLDKDSLAIL